MSGTAFDDDSVKTAMAYSYLRHTELKQPMNQFKKSTATTND